MADQKTNRGIQEGNPDELLGSLEARLAIAETAELWNDWASLQYQLGEIVRAEQGYRRALELEPGYRQAAVNLGLMLLSEGRKQEAAPVLEAHRETLTAPEQNLIDHLTARAPNHPSIPKRPKLSIVMPSNRTGLRTYARIFDACSCASGEIEVIIRDNSGSEEKRRILSLISSENCRVLIASPCSGKENVQQALALAEGDYIFFIADDDVLPTGSISRVIELCRTCSEDSSISGITGGYLIERDSGTQFFRYPPLEADSPSQRIQAYLDSFGANAINYSLVRRDVLRAVQAFHTKSPLCFSFIDQIVALMHLSLGKFVYADQILYQYNCSNWDTPEQALQSDLRYIREAGLDGSTVRLMWLICGLEGAKIVLGNFTGLQLAQEERDNLAGIWMQRMYARFIASMSRTDPSSCFDREALELCNKWKHVTQVQLEPLLADISEFMTLSDRRIAERYFDFWRG